jgi:MFS family permease
VLLAGQSPTLIWGFILGFGAAQGMATLVRPAILTELYGVSHFGRISAVMGFCLVICQTFAPFGASLLYDWRGSYQAVLWIVTFLAVLATGATVVAWREIVASGAARRERFASRAHAAHKAPITSTLSTSEGEGN